MRKVILAVLVLTAAGAAESADLDYDYLRGSDYDPPPAPVVNWSGGYVGGHGGYTSGSIDKRENVATILSTYANTAGVGSRYSVSSEGIYTSRGPNASFGAYAGYNVQFDDVVLGIEADYTHNSKKALWNGTAISTFPPATVTSTYRTSFSDYGTIRARAGYAIGSFLPYVTGGLAIGEANFSQNLYTAPYPSAPFRQITTSKLVTGVAAGAGIEYAVTPDILLRAEYQYLNFTEFNGRQAQFNTFRGGAAVKF